MSDGKPNPRLSEVFDAQAVMQAEISTAIHKSMQAFIGKTGLIPTEVEVTLVNHFTGSHVDDVMATNVKVRWFQP